MPGGRALHNVLQFANVAGEIVRNGDRITNIVVASNYGATILLDCIY